MLTLICSECGRGKYRAVSGRLARCTYCAHEIAPGDVVLDSGEILRWDTDKIVVVMFA